MIKTIIGLLSILIVVGTLSTIHAEIMSPLQQSNQGIPNDMIQCKIGKTLIESPSKKPACVFEDTAKELENRGWVILQTQIEITDVESKVSDISSEIIQIHSPPVEPTPRKIGELGVDPACLWQDSISLEVPNRVRVGELFNVTATFSFNENSLDKEYWDRWCNTYLQIRYPPNYQASGEGLVQGRTFVNDRFVPPPVSHGMVIPHLEYKQAPITFQMKMVELEDAVYDVGGYVYSQNYDIFDLNTLSDDDLYDYGHFSIARHNGDIRAAVYTSISDGIIDLSATKFLSGQNDDSKPKLADPGALPPNLTYIEVDPSQISSDVPFEWIVEELEGQFKGEDPATFIKRFELNDTYVREFLEAYPKFKTQSFSSILN